MMRAGIVGAGYIASSHAAAYGRVAGVELAVIADPRLEHAQRLAAKHGAQAVASVEELLASDVEIVSICTPTAMHAELAIAAMRAGKHVLCEKPIARSVEEADAMIAEAERCNVKFMVGHVSRFEADHQQARKVLLRGDLGDLRMASQSITGSFPEWSAGGWFADVDKSGGPLVDLAIHSFDYILWLFNSPVIRVSAVGVKHAINLHTYALTTLRFANGGIATVEVSWAHPPVATGVSLITELAGTAGRLSWTYDEITSMRVQTGDSRRNVLMAGENSFTREIEAFVQSVAQDTPPPVSGSEARDALRVALAALESLETGRTVHLEAV